MTEEKETKPMVKVTFRLDVLRPDKRQFKQQSMELVPEKPLTVQVEVPCTSEYIVNSANINAAVLGNDSVPDPVLTSAGLAYLSNQIEQHFSDPEPSEEDTGWETEAEKSDTGWEAEEDSDWESDDSSSEDENWSDNDSDWE